VAQTRLDTLVKLSQSDLMLTDSAEDIRGRSVRDRSGEEIGKVEDLVIDTTDRKVRLMQVAAGGVLGIGEKKFLVPIDAITRITEDEVDIDQERSRVIGGPEYNPDLVPEDYYDQVYGYYGYPPYWTAGYTYPAYPYYR
jgi:sporulation protein YlmC with PRC-barrel domain